MVAGISEWTPEYKRQYQRDYRKRLRGVGYRKVELSLSPRLIASLEKHLKEYGFITHPGAAITDLLEEMVIQWNEDILHE